MTVTLPRNVHESILGAIGWTPMVRLNRIVGEIPAAVYAKLETFNPGNSIKGESRPCPPDPRAQGR